MNAPAYICPCCRQPAERPGIAAKVRELPPVQGAVLRALLETPGEYVPTESLIGKVWDGPDGGPEYARMSLSITVGRLRANIADSGWTVESRQWRGYRVART